MPRHAPLPAAALTLALACALPAHAQFGPLDPRNPHSEYNRFDGRYNRNNPFRAGELPTLLQDPQTGRRVIVLPDGRIVR